MPWYRIRTDVEEIAAIATAKVTGLTQAQKAALDTIASGVHTPPALTDTWVHFHLGSRGNRTAARPCAICGWISERLCDFKLGGGRTCDRPLCRHCTTTPAANKDLCPAHVGPWKAWLAGRTNSVDGDGP